jgi:hypothetical protein
MKHLLDGFVCVNVKKYISHEASVRKGVDTEG